jgi:addiction module HigA family antidote
VPRDITQTAIQQHGGGATAKARGTVEKMRSKGDTERADLWLRIIVATGTLGARARGARAKRKPAGTRPRVPSGRITDILSGRRSITADTAVRLGRYFGNRAQFWLDLQSQYDIAVIEREHGAEIAKRVRPSDAA